MTDRQLRRRVKELQYQIERLEQDQTFNVRFAFVLGAAVSAIIMTIIFEQWIS